jgi:integrase
MPKQSPLPRYLFKVRSTFYVRVAIPKALRSFYDGKDIIIRSLGTGDPKVAEGRKDIAVGKIKAEFERLRTRSAFDAVAAALSVRWEAGPDDHGKMAVGNEEQAIALGALAVEAMTTDDPAHKTELEDQKRTLLEAERLKAAQWGSDLSQRRGRFALPPLDTADPATVWAWIREANAFDEFLESGNASSPSTPLHEMVAQISGRNLGEVAQAQVLQEIPAALLPPRARPYLARTANPAVPSDGNWTLGNLITRFFTDRQRASLDAATRRNYTVSFAIMKEVLGENTPIRAIERDAIKEVQEIILHLPARAKSDKRFAGKTFKQQADIAQQAREAGELVPAFKSGTRNKYIRNIGTLFTYARTEGKLTANPALGLSIHLDEDKDEEGKELFSDDDLRAMFPRTYRVEGLNWLPLVMLFHGMRPSEAAQIDVADVVKIGEVWAFDISEETKGATGSARRGDKSLKNDRSAPRIIPIHQRILDLGFLAYLQSRQQAEERKLFAVKRYGEAGYFASIRTGFTDWLKGVGVKRPTTGPHSLRHNWATATFLMVDEALRKVMGGWTLGKAVDVQTYLHRNRLSLADMKAELDKVSFDVLTAEEDPARAHLGLIAPRTTKRAKTAKRPRKELLTSNLEKGYRTPPS